MEMKEVVILLRGLAKGTSDYVSHGELAAILWKVLRAVDNDKVDEAIKKLNTE